MDSEQEVIELDSQVKFEENVGDNEVIVKVQKNMIAGKGPDNKPKYNEQSDSENVEESKRRTWGKRHPLKKGKSLNLEKQKEVYQKILKARNQSDGEDMVTNKISKQYKIKVNYLRNLMFSYEIIEKINQVVESNYSNLTEICTELIGDFIHREYRNLKNSDPEKIKNLFEFVFGYFKDEFQGQDFKTSNQLLFKILSSCKSKLGIQNDQEIKLWKRKAVHRDNRLIGNIPSIKDKKIWNKRNQRRLTTQKKIRSCFKTRRGRPPSRKIPHDESMGDSGKRSESNMVEQKEERPLKKKEEKNVKTTPQVSLIMKQMTKTIDEYLQNCYRNFSNMITERAEMFHYEPTQFERVYQNYGNFEFRVKKKN